MDPFLGEIRLFGFNFAPTGWALCQGQLMSIAQNSALFSLLGTQFGGDGIQTFALPDLRGRVPLGQGQGPGLTPRVVGEQSGQENHTLLTAEMPAHNHPVSANQNANSVSPAGCMPSNDSRGTPYNVYATASDGTVMSPAMIGLTGGNQPHNNMQPNLCINYCIALNGIYPSRS